MEEEKQETNEETPESEIKIIVTEEQPENADDLENTDESAIERDKPDETKEDNDNIVDQTERAAAPDESESLKVPEFDFDSRRESTLSQMDKKNAWLSALEQKCVNLETDFISRIQYVAISNHCQNYLEQLSSDESMTQFRIEFSKLFEKFRIAFVESQRHINKINELKSYRNIANSENRQLKIELEKESEKMQELHVNLDQAHDALRHMEKENKMLQNMFNEISEEKAKDNTKYEQVAENKPLALQGEDEADAKIRQLEEELELISNELEFTKQRESMYQKKIQNAENAKASLQKELNSVKYQFQKQTTRAEKAEAAALENSEDVKNKNVVIKNMTEEIKQVTEDLGRAKDESRRLLKDFRKCQKDLDGTAQVTEKLRRDLDIREDKIKMLVTQKDSLTIELSNKQSEISALKGEIAAISKVKNSLSRRVALLEERCSDAEKKLDSTKKERASLIKELDLIKKELEESDSKKLELTKLKDALTEEAMKLEQTITELENEIKVMRDKGHNLEKELVESKRFADDLTDKIKVLEKTKARLLKEIVELNKNVNDLRDEIKRLELIIADMKKSESKLRQQLSDEYTKYKLLADDERHCRKQLAEFRHECEQLRDDQIVLKKHIEQLQSYNKDLDDRCKKMDLNTKHLTEQLGNAKESHKQEVKTSDDLKIKLKRKEDQEQLLLKNLSEKDHDIFTFKRKAKNLIEEKNVQAAKIIEKDQQIYDLKENLRLLQQEVTTLDKTVNERINDIKLLKIQISQMNKSNFLLQEQLEFIDDTRQELVEAQTKLIEEKVKSKNLEGEMQKPVNLHRWRILEGIDPERAQLVAKNQVLQKQLNKKMAELESKETELKEKEKLATDLQNLLKRRAESDSQEQLWICKKELTARMERLKCLVAENDMFQNLCKKYEDEISALKNKLRAHKISELKRRRVSQGENNHH